MGTGSRADEARMMKTKKKKKQLSGSRQRHQTGRDDGGCCRNLSADEDSWFQTIFALLQLYSQCLHEEEPRGFGMGSLQGHGGSQNLSQCDHFQYSY